MNFIHYIAESRWTYLAYWLPLIIFCILFYLRNKSLVLNSIGYILKWTRLSLESNGKPCLEKIIAFGIMNGAFIPCCIIFMVKIFSQIKDEFYVICGGLGCLLIIASFMLMLLRILSPQQLIELKNGLGIEDLKKEEK